MSAELLSRVEAFLREADMPPSTFGVYVLNDPRFVGDLRQGRTPHRLPCRASAAIRLSRRHRGRRVSARRPFLPREYHLPPRNFSRRSRASHRSYALGGSR